MQTEGGNGVAVYIALLPSPFAGSAMAWGAAAAAVGKAVGRPHPRLARWLDRGQPPG
jgi:hypothetical protein